MNTPGKYLRGLVAAAALFAAAPANAEKLTDDQRACVQKVLSNPEADFSAVRACSGPPDKNRQLSPEARQQFLAALEARFNGPKLYDEKGGQLTREKITFDAVRKALEANPSLMWSLARMEETGGAPNLVKVTETEFVFADVSPESPEGRRNLDYDHAEAMAAEMGVQMMSPEMYRALQKRIDLDKETWSWLLTDAATRKTGHAFGGIRVSSEDDDRVMSQGSVGDRNLRYGFRASLTIPR